jgi:hypothetical protein
MGRNLLVIGNVAEDLGRIDDVVVLLNAVAAVGNCHTCGEAYLVGAAIGPAASVQDGEQRNPFGGGGGGGFAIT